MKTDSLSDAIAVIEAFRAANERLRTALKPLADIKLWSDAYPDWGWMDRMDIVSDEHE